MSSTLLRAGLWLMVLVLGVFVVREAYPEAPFAQYVQDALLQQALILSAVLILAGFVSKLLEKGQKVVLKNRCKVCSKAVPPGAIYCREHLRTVLDLEDRKTHNTRIR